MQNRSKLRLISERLRFYWHEVYYKLVPPSGVKLAMTCKHVVEQIDLVDPSVTWMQWFRLKLHLSLCQACAYYFSASRALRRFAREVQRDAQSANDLEEINRSLLDKHARRGEPGDS